ncbi:MAG: carbohydrate ABC transporter permease [Spirochaetales bacterium]|nr:carbohydrate ABC transporter permease [Spirochaetales bacterium]
METAISAGNGQTFSGVIGKVISYFVFGVWILITLVPLVWMGYSSFKTNEELNLDIYALPKAMFDNEFDEYVVVKPQLNIIYPYDPKVDTRERIIIESTTIAPTRRLMLQFLVKEEMPPEIQNLKYGDTLTLDQLPRKLARKISWDTVWFNYTSAFIRGGLAGKFANSIIYSGVSTFFIILLGAMIGFALAKMQFKKISAVVMGIIGLGYLLSIQSVIIPLFLMLSSLKLTDTHLGIILVYTAFGMPLSVLLCTQFMQGLPDSLIESAYIDGATPFRAFRSIIMPMARPVVVTVGIISVLGIWNEFLLVLVLASSEFTKSLPVGVFSFSSLTGTQLGWQLAALVIATIPAMIVYFSFQKRLAQGVVGGALKG